MLPLFDQSGIIRCQRMDSQPRKIMIEITFFKIICCVLRYAFAPYQLFDQIHQIASNPLCTSMSIFVEDGQTSGASDAASPSNPVKPVVVRHCKQPVHFGTSVGNTVDGMPARLSDHEFVPRASNVDLGVKNLFGVCRPGRPSAAPLAAVVSGRWFYDI